MKDDLTFVRFEVPGKPTQWQRRVVSKRGFSFMPKEVTAYKSLVVDAYIQATHRTQQKPHDGPVAMVIKSYWPIPKSRPKWWKALAAFETVAYTKTPDHDNVLKLIGDALNHVAYADDRLIYSSACQMFYSERPHLEVCLYFYDEPTRPAKEKKNNSE